jgi:hypothetical protein
LRATLLERTSGPRIHPNNSAAITESTYEKGLLWTCAARQYTGDCIRNVVVAASCVIDAVAPAAGRPAFEADQLRQQSSMIQQLNASAVEQRQQITVEV